jgi:hypothetical protein
MSDFSYNSEFLALHGLYFSPGQQGDKSDLASLQILNHSSGLRVRAARDPAEVEQAQELVNRRYAWRGYAGKEIASGATAITLIAERGAEMMGTVTIHRDSDAGLLIDHTFEAEANDFRRNGRSLCEVTRLATTPESDSRTVLCMLFHIAFFSCLRLYNATDLFIEVNPRHERYYRQWMDFVVASGRRICARVEAPAMLLRLDMGTAQPDRWLKPLLNGPLPMAA